MVVQPSFRDTILIFLRRKLVFGSAFLAVCVAAAAYLLLATPLYSSRASLVLRFDSKPVPDIDRNMRQGAPMQGVNEHQEILHSDADILRSPDIARLVVRDLGLAALYPKIAAKPETEKRKLDTAIQSFSSDLVVNVGVDSDVINISFLAHDPALAQRAVQQLLTVFYGQEAVIYANPELQFAQQEAARAKEKLSEAQNELAAFKKSHEIADLHAQVGQFLQQRTDVTSRLATAQGALAQAQQQEAALKELLQTVPQQVNSSATGEQFQAADSAASELDKLKAERQRMQSTWKPGSPVFAQLDAQIGSLEHAVNARTRSGRTRTDFQPSKIYESIKTDYLRADAQARSNEKPVKVLQDQLTDINQRINQLEADNTHYDDLMRAVQIHADTYRALAIRGQEAEIEANRNAQKISAAAVIAAPSLPDRPAKPRKKLIAGAAVFLGLLLGAGLVLVLEAFDDRLRTPREVAHVLRLPVLATFAKDA